MENFAPQISTSPTPEPSKHRQLPWLAFVLSLLVLSVIAALTLQNLQLKKQLSVATKAPILAPTVSLEPSAKANEPTADWENISVKELNLTFKLPPVFKSYGTLEKKIANAEKGFNLCLTFPRKTSSLTHIVYAGGFGSCSPNIFAISANSNGYEAGRSGSYADFQGYKFKNNKYYAIWGLGTEYLKEFEIPQDRLKIFQNPQGIKIVKIFPYSGDVDFSMSPFDFNNTVVGLINNTNNQEYPGLSVSLDLKGELNQILFDQILSTFQFLN